MLCPSQPPVCNKKEPQKNTRCKAKIITSQVVRKPGPKNGKYATKTEGGGNDP